MARRNPKQPKVFPIAGAITKPLATAPIADSSRLLLERFLSAQDMVIASANAAADAYVRTAMKLDDIDPEEGWMFNRRKMRWEKHPVVADA